MGRGMAKEWAGGKANIGASASLVRCAEGGKHGEQQPQGLGGPRKGVMRARLWHRRMSARSRKRVASKSSSVSILWVASRAITLRGFEQWEAGGAVRATRAKAANIARCCSLLRWSCNQSRLPAGQFRRQGP